MPNFFSKKYHGLKNKIDNYFSEIFRTDKDKNKDKESGFAITGTILIGLGIAASISALWKWIVSGDSFAIALIKGVGNIIYAIAYYVAALSAKIFGYALPYLDEAITKGNSPFVHAWTTTRDLGNMAIVLGFVIIGIATALRLESYPVKKLLPKLIGVAVLINFSPLLCGLIIDASNILYHSANIIATESMATTIVQNIDNSLYGTKDIPYDKPIPAQQGYWSVSVGTGMGSSNYKDTNTPPPADPSKGTTITSYNSVSVWIPPVEAHSEPQIIKDGQINNPAYKDNATATTGVLGAYSLMQLVVAGTFFYLSIIIAQRYVFLGIYFILAPLGFVCWAFPQTNKYWKSWWEGLIRWAFIGLAASFLVVLGSDILQAPGGSDDLKKLFIALVFFVASFHFAKKHSGNVGAMAYGLATGAAGFALGATGKIAGGLANKTGASRIGNSIKNSTGKALEWAGFRQAGTTAGNATKEMDERQKTVGNLSTDQQAKLATRWGPGKDTARNRVAAIKNLVKGGDLDKVGNVDAQNRAIKEVENYEKSRGISSNIRKDAEEKNYRLAAHNEKKTNNALLASGINPALATTAQKTAAGQKARQNQLITNLPKMSSNALADIDPADITPDIVREHMNPAMIDKLQIAPNQHLRDNLRLQVDSQNGNPGALRVAYNNAAAPGGNKAEANKLRKQIEAIQRLP